MRILVFLIFLLCFYYFRKKKESFKFKYSKKAKTIRVTAAILILAILFIPYEALFIRFDSAEASVRYFTVNYNAPIKTIETDKTAFCVGHRDNNFYYNTVTKNGDKYGFCDWHSHNVLGYIHEEIDDGQFKGLYSVAKLINTEANEKCYLIKFLSVNQKEADKICIYDKHNTPIKKLTFPDNRTVFAVVVDQIDKTTSFTFNGKTYVLN